MEITNVEMIESKTIECILIKLDTDVALDERMNLIIISPPPVKPEGTIGLHSVRQSVCQSVCLSVRLSVRHTRFPDFSSLYFHISG